MKKQKLIFASDHAGFELKQPLIEFLGAQGFECVDLGPSSADRVDYPDYAKKLAVALQNEKSEKNSNTFGILICGSGIGVSIQANRYTHIRAVNCSFEYHAKFARLHNDANVLCLGARVVGIDLAKEIIRVFLKTNFEGGRHRLRVGKLGQNSQSIF